MLHCKKSAGQIEICVVPFLHFFFTVRTFSHSIIFFFCLTCGTLTYSLVHSTNAEVTALTSRPNLHVFCYHRKHCGIFGDCLRSRLVSPREVSSCLTRRKKKGTKEPAAEATGKFSAPTGCVTKILPRKVVRHREEYRTSHKHLTPGSSAPSRRTLLSSTHSTHTSTNFDE